MKPRQETLQFSIKKGLNQAKKSQHMSRVARGQFQGPSTSVNCNNIFDLLSDEKVIAYKLP